jgi:hypothetical protein
MTVIASLSVIGISGAVLATNVAAGKLFTHLHS